MTKILVLVVDDSLFMRKVITDMLGEDPEIEVVGQASNGIDALEKISKLTPDIVTLDFQMPKMDGLQTLKEISRLGFKTRVVMVSGFTQKDAQITLSCLAAGAVDFVTKPSGPVSLEMTTVKKELLEKIKIAAQVNPKLTIPTQQRMRKYYEASSKHHGVGAVVIGSSTGGPAALEALLPMFPENFLTPIFVNQHLPKSFTKTFAQRLNKECILNVLEGSDGLIVKPKTVYVAPGGSDMQVVRNDSGEIALAIVPSKGGETPSVNVLMESVAKIYGSNAIGVILTGMGSDGLEGMAKIKKNGGKTIVQDEKSSVIFGMGKVVVEKGLADNVLPLDQIVDKIIQLQT